MAPAHADGLFLSGDVGQRIFQHPFSWASLGMDVRGRSHTLKVCYRTSQQIRRAADRLLPAVLRDTDGLEDERRGVISVFDGPVPEVKCLPSVAAEAEMVREVVGAWLADGIAAHEVGLFVRTPGLVPRARAAIAGLAGAGDVVTVPMSLAKGLEFRAVVVMACDEGTLPLDERVADAADEAELDDIYETERRLLYVACTRARASAPDRRGSDNRIPGRFRCKEVIYVRGHHGILGVSGVGHGWKQRITHENSLAPL